MSYILVDACRLNSQQQSQRNPREEFHLRYRTGGRPDSLSYYPTLDLRFRFLGRRARVISWESNEK